ncbi:MAG: zinc metallopeptidase [Clostridiales bacterium]|nr:zinc metallopeptidase [Clostridiales bacterium]
MIYYIYYILGIVMIPGIIMGIWAQSKVFSTFNHYNKIETKHGKSASEVARYMLDSVGCVDTKIKPIKGELTDNFDPRNNTVSLSESVYNERSVASIGVACHEIGHVIQHKEKYAPIQVRNKLVPVINVLGYFAWPLIFIGLIAEIIFYATFAKWLIWVGVGVYALNTIFCLITLPIERNASKRAYKMLVSTGEMDEKEAEGVKKVLDAASLTYVAALVTSILSLLRLLLFIFIAREK